MNSPLSRFPACLVRFPEPSGPRRAPFYLAAEEYLAAACPADDYLFSWTVGPTVVMGRNQVAEREIDLPFCRREGIDVVRRKSGGGCIYADGGNLMFSLVTGGGAVEPLFADYAATVAGALTRLGAEARVSGRNDIVLKGGGKVCGNAFYHLARRNVVHGTMLYDTDYRLMSGALLPDAGKLGARGVGSVRARTALIRDVLPIGADRLRRELERRLTDRRILLTDHDVRQIREIERAYYADGWLFGRKAVPTATVSTGRVEGMGTLELRFTAPRGVVEAVALAGDFLACRGEADAAFSAAFAGVPLTAAALREAAIAHGPEKAVRGLTQERLLALLDALPDEAGGGRCVPSDCP